MAAAVPIESNNNDVWKVNDVYLRVAWRGDRTRLAREAEVMQAVSALLPVPEVVALGGDEVVAWAISRESRGRSGADLFVRPRPGDEPRVVMAELAGMLRDPHTWTPPASLLQLLAERPGQVSGDPMAIVGADVVPLPIERAMALVEPLKTIPFVDSGVVGGAADRIRSLAAVDVTPSDKIIHGDLGPVNVLVEDNRITAVLDFEFARTGPADLELISTVRGADATRQVGHRPPPLIDWLRQDYPELFGHPDLERRLWLYALAYTLRHILFWPPDRPDGDGLDPSHPVHTLRRLIDGPLPM